MNSAGWALHRPFPASLRCQRIARHASATMTYHYASPVHGLACTTRLNWLHPKFVLRCYQIRQRAGPGFEVEEVWVKCAVKLVDLIIEGSKPPEVFFSKSWKGKRMIEISKTNFQNRHSAECNQIASSITANGKCLVKWNTVQCTERKYTDLPSRWNLISNDHRCC